ncbi:prostaglandin reductase 1-like [Aricia agestis]|uniref:prostaglandin reductase 1-like n=1 Tax=Aricia agestis TaxID=91739 RepID=UPI001C207225|nr:prostaglandin reductase 1-like [Aricia agestis]
MKARKYVVKNHFNGIPKREDYEVIEYELPSLVDGDILIKAEWVSVDPYMKVFSSNFPTPYDQFGFQTGVVLESKDPKYPRGTKVVSHAGWCDYCVINPGKFTSDFEIIYKMPDLQDLSDSIALSAAGMVGATAYFGLLEICKPKAGETLVVTVAAGAVGSIVGQIGMIVGCRVVGFTGSDEKVRWLEDEIGYDRAFNYKTTDIDEALKEAAPDGVDCYFDNVGGEMSSIIMNHMNEFGRVSVCGCISAYTAEEDNFPKASTTQLNIFLKQLKIEGFIVLRWLNEWPTAFRDITSWIKSGEIKIKEHVLEGFDNIFDAFISMISGANTGKVVVKL